MPVSRNEVVGRVGEPQRKYIQVLKQFPREFKIATGSKNTGRP